ncbi:hypothetical protein HXX76_005239 [Chlamydomonas incerta]|uniref:Uncharacterized protein n=1 Tax=Chlamydomonas incerta TaxID=51695 RepID=A0A835T945_CHLIN|nr:hypothetical protein HXX76_005239 [Chlamydomonas incerta]|eukprot:KAG2438693.1 hypothetical protein HXX76_005239 [Chlamydomonas incerta]
MKEYSVVETENSRLRARLRVIEAVLPVRQRMQKQPSQPLPTGTTITGTGMAGTPPQSQLLKVEPGEPADRATGSEDLYCMSGDAGGSVGGAGGAIVVVPPLTTPFQLQHQASLQHQHSLQAQASQQLPSSHPQAQQQQQAASTGAVSSSTTSATAPPLGLLRLAADSPTASPHRSSTEPDLDSGCSPLLHPSASTLEHWLRLRPASCKQQQHQQQGRSPDEDRWLEIWKAWVREASLLVQVHDARPNEIYVRRLDEAFARLRQAEHELDLAHPELICNMRQVNMETGVEEVPPDSFWTLVASGMRLTPAQVADCRTALTLYRERMEVVMAERRSLADQLSSCMGALHLAEAEGRAAPGSMQRERLTLEAEEVAAALHANVLAEGHTTGLARDLLRSDLFNSTQCARGSMLSYPYYPDALAIVAAVVANADAAATAQQAATGGDGSGSGSGKGGDGPQ